MKDYRTDCRTDCMTDDKIDDTLSGIKEVDNLIAIDRDIKEMQAELRRLRTHQIEVKDKAIRALVEQGKTEMLDINISKINRMHMRSDIKY